MKQRGFTLIELSAVILIAVILLTLAVPSFQQTIVNSRLTSASNDFVTAVHFARNTALTSRSNTVLKSISGTSDWSQGWKVETSTGTLLKLVEQNLSNVVINANTKTSFTYNEVGVVDNSETLKVCSSATSNNRIISVMASGFVKVSNGTC